jgi:hypothetical protein
MNSSEIHRGFFWQKISRWRFGFSFFVPDDPEKAVKVSPGNGIFLSRNQEKATKVIQLPDIHKFHKTESEVLQRDKVITSLVREED